MTRLKEGITTTGYSLMAWCRHPLAWIGPWLVGVCFTLFGMYLKADVLFLLTALLGWRPLFRMMGGWIRGRHRARSQAKRVRPDAGASTGGTGTNARARAKGAAARIDAFQGFELTVGTIYGMRAWRLHGGLLRPVHSNDAPWIAGENVADCFMTRLFEGHKAPVESCGCGFYAYTRPDTKPTLFVRGVIEGYGRTIVGTKGFRCEKARIVAFLDPRGRLSDGRALYKALRDGYPDVPIYHTQRAMLRAFPLGDE